MTQATTFDFVVLDATLTHKQYQEDKIAGRTPNVDEDTMRKAVQAVRQQ
jgi:hypothetical protein